MRTKAVYVVVSGDKDIYFEQAWVSAWSLKHYNPEMRVECVVDQDTYDNIVTGYRKKALEIIDELVKIEVPIEYTKKEQSRWLKTNLRNLVQGDYLFIDTDTVICDRLAEIDDFEHDVMMVQDSHCPLSKIPSRNNVQKDIVTILGKELNTDTFFNSGVIFCRDTEKARSLYEEWHKTWMLSRSKGIPVDQRALAIAMDGHDCVYEMDGIYNCQVRFSYKYLFKAKIMHFFNSPWYQDCINPFFGKQVYLEVKQNQGISVEMQNMILDCKSLFVAPSLTIAEEELAVRNTKAFSFLVRIQKRYPRYYSFIQWTAFIQHKLLSGIQKVTRRVK